MTYKFLIAVLAVAIPLRASTSYATSSAMQTDNAALTFSSVSFDPLGQQTYFPTLDLGDGLTFSGAGGLSAITTTINPGASWPAGDILKGGGNGGEIDITLPPGTLAFGASFGEVGGAVTDITVSVTDATGQHSYTISPSSGQPVYLGIASLSEFSHISFTTGFSFSALALNNFVYGTGSGSSGGGGGGDPDPPETVEPATMALEGLGLLILSAFRRRVRKVRSWLGVAQSE